MGGLPRAAPRQLRRRRASNPDYFGRDAEEKALGLYQLVGPDGQLSDAVSPPGGSTEDADLARAMYRGMAKIRVMDARLLALQRQGRIGFYGEARGQEAAVVGSAAATIAADWVVPALREAGVGIYRGMPMEDYVSQIYGNADDGCHGRQMPCHPCHRESNYVVMSSCVASQIPHAVGIAHAMKILGHGGRACVGYMGDGATSAADFHVAMNFAGVFAAPVVLICQNNQWAISTPGSVQTAAETIACKGIGYGIESLRADGNDVFAVYEVTRYALEKARRGDGPTFIELVTYRVGAHSSSDDPSRYRDEAVSEMWRRDRDPLQRLGRYLQDREWLSAEEQRAVLEELEVEVRAVIASAEEVPAPPVDTLIEDVFFAPTWRLREQLEALRRSVPTA